MVSSERREQEVVSGNDSKERQITFLQEELARSQEKIQTLHKEVNSAETRADTAVSRERGECFGLWDRVQGYMEMVK